MRFRLNIKIERNIQNVRYRTKGVSGHGAAQIKHGFGIIRVRSVPLRDFPPLYYYLGIALSKYVAQLL